MRELLGAGAELFRVHHADLTRQTRPAVAGLERDRQRLTGPRRLAR